MALKKTMEQLQDIGLGEYEARAYVGLLKHSPLNGYELAKATGLPRANVYAVLKKLEGRGAVLRMDTEGGVRYSPVPPEELTGRLGRQYRDALEAARTSLESLVVPPEQEQVWNVRGYSALIESARALIDGAQCRLQLAVSPPEAASLSDAAARAQARGVEVTTLCREGCAEECGGCRGRVYRYRVNPEADSRWLVILPDGDEMIAGEIGASEDAAQGVRTRQRLLVDLTDWYIRNTIALAAVLGDLGERLDGWLAPETRSILSTLGTQAGPRGWLEYMRGLLKGPSEVEG